MDMQKYSLNFSNAFNNTKEIGCDVNIENSKLSLFKLQQIRICAEAETDRCVETYGIEEVSLSCFKLHLRIAHMIKNTFKDVFPIVTIGKTFIEGSDIFGEIDIDYLLEFIKSGKRYVGSDPLNLHAWITIWSDDIFYIIDCSLPLFLVRKGFWNENSSEPIFFMKDAPVEIHGDHEYLPIILSGDYLKNLNVLSPGWTPDNPKWHILF